MTEEIKQLSNVSFKLTDEVISRNWMSVNARKTRLLSLSDWTQMPDVPLPQNIRNVWRQWRSKVRAVKRSAYTDPSKAMEALKSLELQIPEGISEEALAEVADMPALPNPEMDAIKQQLVDVIRNHVDTEVAPKVITMADVEKLIDVKLDAVQQMLLENFQMSLEKKLSNFVEKSPPSEDKRTWGEALDDLHTFIDKKFARPAFDEELFQEAVDFLSNNEADTTFPLLTVHAEFSSVKLSEMAQKIINGRRVWLKEACEMERQRLEFREKAFTCGTIAALDAFREKIINPDGH